MGEYAEILATTGKILGVDFGDVRTGIAVSDPSRMLALCLETVSPGGIEKTADKVTEIAISERVSAVIVGLPVNMDGSHGPRAERCEKLCRLLRERLAVPVATYDERMTTMTAARFLNETDTHGKKRKQVIDTLSAQIILQNCLDRLKNLKERENV